MQTLSLQYELKVGQHVLVSVVGFPAAQIRARITRLDPTAPDYVWVTTASIVDSGTKLVLVRAKVVAVACALHDVMHVRVCGLCAQKVADATGDLALRIAANGEALVIAAKKVAQLLYQYQSTSDELTELSSVLELIECRPNTLAPAVQS